MPKPGKASCSLIIHERIMPNNPVEVLNPGFYNEFLADSLHPLRLALADNNLTNWAPEAPVNLYYCSNDQHVTYLNAIIASEAMNNLEGASIELTEINAAYDHYECAEPSITQAILTFLIESELCNTSITENPTLKNQISPNPSSKNFSFISEGHDLLSIFSLNGQLHLNAKVKPGNNTIDISELSPGLYIVRSEKKSQKLVIK